MADVLSFPSIDKLLSVYVRGDDRKVWRARIGKGIYFILANTYDEASYAAMEAARIMIEPIGLDELMEGLERLAQGTSLEELRPEEKETAAPSTEFTSPKPAKKRGRPKGS